MGGAGITGITGGEEQVLQERSSRDYRRRGERKLKGLGQMKEM